MFVDPGLDDARALLALWSGGAADLRRRLTPDPAGVSAPIKVADREYAVTRLDFAAGHLRAALDRDWDEEHVRSHLYQLWPEFVPARAGAATKARVVAVSRSPKTPLYYGAAGLATTPSAGSAGIVTTVRSYGGRVGIRLERHDPGVLPAVRRRTAARLRVGRRRRHRTGPGG